MILQTITDLPNIPKRIVSLVPSQTELLYDLDLEKETVGITKFCIHPQKWFVTKTRVGGTKMIKPGIIDQLQPDLIIANKEENVKEQIEKLAEDYPVWVTDVNNLEDALQMISDIGALTGKQKEAETLVKKISDGFCRFTEMKNQHSAGLFLSTAYLIWWNPCMTVGSNTFIHDMLTKCSLKNMFAHLDRYPEITIAELATKKCNLVLLPSEPYPFKEEHKKELQNRLPEAKIVLVDGEMFSWYGSRLLQTPVYFEKLLSGLL